MATERQMQANRQNAQLSTGPCTLEGKAQVSCNARKHGLTAAKWIVLPGEDPEAYETFRDRIWEDCAPRGALEEAMVEQIVIHLWQLRRIPLLEAALHRLEPLDARIAGLNSTLRSCREPSPMEEFHKAAYDTNVLPERQKTFESSKREAAEVIAERDADQPLQALLVFAKHVETHEKLSRYQEGHLRSLFRLLHELQRLQAMRAGNQVAPPEVVEVDLNVTQNGVDSM